MGLVRLLSFPSLQLYRPCLRLPLLLQPAPPLPDPVAHIPQDTLQCAPWLYSLHALHSADHKSLFHSFCRLSLCTLSRCAWCTLSHLPNLWCQFLSVCALFVSPPLAPPFISVIFLLFLLFLPLIFHCFCASFLHKAPPLFTLSFQIPQWALLVQWAIHCQHIAHGWGVAPQRNII